MTNKRGTTPSQTIGPFHRIMVPWEGGGDLVAVDDSSAIRIEGHVYDGAGEPVDDCVIEIWQADIHGRYAHFEDVRETPLVKGFYGFGRTVTDGRGCFEIVTVKPGHVPGPGNNVQAPHISLSIFARGLLRQLATRVYFPDESASNAKDPVLLSIADPARQATLVAVKRKRADIPPVYEFDIHLQGARETIFFDV